MRNAMANHASVSVVLKQREHPDRSDYMFHGRGKKSKFLGGKRPSQYDTVLRLLDGKKMDMDEILEIMIGTPRPSLRRVLSDLKRVHGLVRKDWKTLKWERI